MCSSTSMDTSFGSDASSAEMPAVAPATNPRAHRSRQPTLPWVDLSSLPKMYSTSENLLSNCKSLVQGSPPYSSVMESLVTPLVIMGSTTALSATLSEESEELDISTTAYVKDVDADKVNITQNHGHEHRTSCSTLLEGLGNNSGSASEAAANRIHAELNPSLPVSVPQQEPKQETASSESPMAATTSSFGEVGGATAVTQHCDSNRSMSSRESKVEDVLVIPCPPLLRSQFTSKKTRDAELNDQQFSRKSLDMPSFHSMRVAFSFSAGAAERQSSFPSPPAAASSSGLCSLPSLALKHGSQRFPNFLHHQLMQQQRQRKRTSSSQDYTVAPVAVASSDLALSSSTGTRASVGKLRPRSPGPNAGSSDSGGQRPSSRRSTGRRCLLPPSPPLEPFSPSHRNATNAHPTLTSSPTLSSLPQAEVHEAIAISADSKCVSGDHKSGPDSTTIFPINLPPTDGLAIGLSSPGATAGMPCRPQLQSLPQGLLSPTLRALPKGWASPSFIRSLHSPASSATGNDSQSVNPRMNAALVDLDVVARSAPPTSAGCADSALTPTDEHATEAQRESARLRPLEANLCALFSGSAYADGRSSAELGVLRVLPVTRTFLHPAAVKAAVAATTTPSTFRHSLLPEGPLPGTRPSSGTDGIRCDVIRRCSKEAAVAPLPIFVVPTGNVKAEAWASSTSVSVCSTSLQNPLRQMTPTSSNPQQQQQQHCNDNVINTNSSSDSTDGKCDTAACRINDVVDTNKVAYDRASGPRIVAGDAGMGTAPSPISEVRTTSDLKNRNDAVIIEKAIVSSVGITSSMSPAPLPPKTTVIGLQKGPFRFYSVLQRNEDHRGRSTLLSLNSSISSSAEAGEGWTAMSNEAEAVVNGSLCSHGRVPGTERHVLRTPLQKSAGAAEAKNASSKSERFKEAHKRCSRQRGHCKEWAGECLRESSLASALTSHTSRKELWTGLQLPRSTVAGNVSFTNTAGQRLYPICSLKRRSGHETGMRHMNSDMCFGTFIPSVDSFRSFLEDHQSSFYLVTATNDRTGASGKQSTSPNYASLYVRHEHSKLGGSSRDNGQGKRESRGIDWDVASTASRQCCVAHDQYAPLVRNHSSQSNSSHHTLPSCTSILSSAFEGAVSPGPSETARPQQGAVAAKGHSSKRVQSLASLPTSTSTVTSRCSKEETLPLDGSAERCKSQERARCGSSGASRLPARAASPSDRQAFGQNVPQQLSSSESPKRPEISCPSDAAPKAVLRGPPSNQ
ncbi:hypothetical protein, unknown function [Leishmania tarentolae]|uniref:Uncharacterized protein n=1 Tax=Leishmania tarentolae TaxID=5689 RepID=A0A640KEM0_LEITA|nr:hypothetical protein, unknown function [Leishmania tarentolae]